MKIAKPLCLRAASSHDGADGTRAVSHVATVVTYGRETRGWLANLAENNKNPRRAGVDGEAGAREGSREAFWIRATPRRENKAVHF